MRNAMPALKRPRSALRKETAKAPKPAAVKPNESEAKPKAKTRSFLRNVRKKRSRTKKKSGLEILVETELTARNIEFLTQYPVGRCHADLYFPRTNTIVELHGCYWHGHTVCQKTPKKRRRYLDARRYTFFRNKGYGLLIVWECEVKKNLPEVMTRLLEAAGVLHA
jgi:DNA mismatch endonuclease (patch repair protein)